MTREQLARGEHWLGSNTELSKEELSLAMELALRKKVITTPLVMTVKEIVFASLKDKKTMRNYHLLTAIAEDILRTSPLVPAKKAIARQA